MLRKVRDPHYERERITTSDDDFLDLDWKRAGNPQLVIICHGLEGNTNRPYLKGMADYFFRKDWDVLTWNYRGCSEEMNRKLRFYHSGATNDLEEVINHALNHHHYTDVSLLGFSLGGNMVLKYLGEQGEQVDPRLQKAMALSVPLDLHAGCLQISSGFNRVYSFRFLRRLKAKVRRKALQFPDAFDLNALNRTRSLVEFDHLFTAPIHGFDSAIDYYQRCSAQRFLDTISIPTLIVNARNDPFLAPSCYPVDRLSNHPKVDLLVPEQGGHCGFADREFAPDYWSEVMAWNFMNS